MWIVTLSDGRSIRTSSSDRAFTFEDYARMIGLKSKISYHWKVA